MKNITKIFIDIIIFNGDIEVNKPFTNNNDFVVDQYESINKIFISIKINKNAQLPDKLDFSIKSISNSFYKILYNFAVEGIDDSLITNKIQTGFSYLATIDPSIRESYNIGNKIITINNPNVEHLKPIAISFFSLNCQIEVGQVYKNKDNEPIYAKAMQYDQISFDLIDPAIETEKDRYIENLEYRINVVENKTEYEGNLCNLYVSANEVSQNHEDNSTDIIIPDNIAQQVMFGNDFNHVSYGYVHVNINKDLAIKFYPKHRAQYTIKIYYNFEDSKNIKTILSNEIIYLEYREWREQCPKSQNYCYIQLDITLEEAKDIENPVLEFSIESIDDSIDTNSVSYLPQNIMKMDYTHNFNSKYFYTVLGDSKEGFVIINFLRGSGSIYARIVEKNKIEKDGNWRGKYILPNETHSLKMDDFTQKISFNTYGQNCRKGCYLIIKTLSDSKSFINITHFPFSIIIHTHEFNIINNYNIPLIKIPTDEYIVGTVSEYTNNEIYQFYSVLINLDCEQILIDFQSKTGGLFINVGYEKPTTSNSNFTILSNGKDQILTIKKNEILEIAKKIHEYKMFTDIKDIVLTIGVQTNISDSGDTTPFAFIVRLNTGINDIYSINSEQKALCITKKISENKYRCVYAIKYAYISIINFLFIYPKAKSKTALIEAYGKSIDKIDYEIDPNNKLKDLIPNKNKYDYSTHDSNGDYLYIKTGFAKDTYFLVSVETDTETTIELLTSFYIMQTEATANPRTPQIFIISNNQTFTLKFPENYKEMVNIVCIAGKAEIFWESVPEDKYYIGGEEDKISITSENSGKSHILKIVPLTIFEKALNLVFYVESDVRPNRFNFDELILDTSNYYMYSDSDLPISFYTPIDKSIMNNSEYYDLFFSFDILNNNEVINYYEYIPFSINAYIIKQNTVWNIKRNPDMAPQTENPLEGQYDPLLKTGFIRISKENIAQVKEEDQPNLFVIIKKSVNNIQHSEIKFNQVGLEVSAVKSSPEIPVSQLSYQFGKLEINQKEKLYSLNMDNSFKYINLIFSCENNNALSIKIQDRNDLKEEAEKYGRKVYSLTTKANQFSVILVISRNSANLTKEEYFTFQYRHSNNSYSDNYKISNTALGINKDFIENQRKNNIEKMNLSITIDPVQNSQNYEVHYIVKGFERSLIHSPEKADLSLHFDNTKYIAEYNNPQIDKSTNKLQLNLKNIPNKIDFIQVIAQIMDKEIVEYLSYDLFEIKIKDGKDGSTKNNNFILIIAIILGFLFVIILILGVTLIIYFNRNKGLLDQVNKVSFRISKASERDIENKDVLISKSENDK